MPFRLYFLSPRKISLSDSASKHLPTRRLCSLFRRGGVSFMLDNLSRMNQGVAILIIEDNWLFTEMLCEAIQLLQPTWRIYAAKNGQEGLAMVQMQHPDLILLDFYMPGMNGWELALALQQSPETSSIPL